MQGTTAEWPSESRKRARACRVLQALPHTSLNKSTMPGSSMSYVVTHFCSETGRGTEAVKRCAEASASSPAQCQRDPQHGPPAAARPGDERKVSNGRGLPQMYLASPTSGSAEPETDGTCGRTRPLPLLRYFQGQCVYQHATGQRHRRRALKVRRHRAQHRCYRALLRICKPPLQTALTPPALALQALAKHVHKVVEEIVEVGHAKRHGKRGACTSARA